MRKLHFFFISFLFFSGIRYAAAQPYFLWNDSIKVKTDLGYLPNPWAGGLNFVQVSNIDLDLDGTKDLFFFDRTGDKIRTFIKKGAAGSLTYQYDPSYENKFPTIHEWALLVDYNCDGKEDIFCYSSIGAGFDVYKNTSGPSTGLQFQKVVTQQLSAFYPDAPPTEFCSSGKPCNLYVSSVDVPALSDIDNDGDLDVITFELLSGATMIYHKNMSMEKYGHCDSLVFQVANNCWGYATEHPLNNSYTLHDTCIINIANPEITAENNATRRRHAGSAELCIDLDGDGDKEFIVSDISFTNLTMLTNGGTPKNANFIAIDSAFPASKPVDLTLFPCPFYVDADGDGIKDLIVSPNATNACENFQSVLYYKNTGSNSIPTFEFKQNDFLQDQMLDFGEGAYPVFFDYDHDGLQDLFVGNYGYYDRPDFKHRIALLKNTGTATTPQFELVTRDFDSLSTIGLTNMIPAFGDMDGDGDADMIIGDFAGNLYYYQNTAATGAEPVFVLIQPKLRNSVNRIIDVYDDAAPQIIDVDNDGKNDLIVGNRSGKISYYRNTGSGTAVPVLDSMTNFWGQVNVLRPGYVLGNAHPFLFKDNGITKLLVGSSEGYLRLFDNIDNNLTGKFNLVDSTYQQIFQGTRTAPCGADINNDGFLDLVVGNYEGGISFYKGVSRDIVGIETTDHLIHFNFELFPNPADHTMTIRVSEEFNRTYQVEIYNLMGQHISNHLIFNNQLTLDTQTMKQGMYLCKVYEMDSQQNKKSGALTRRFIIQH